MDKKFANRDLRDNSHRYGGQSDRHVQPRQEGSLVGKIDLGFDFNRDLHEKPL